MTSRLAHKPLWLAIVSAGLLTVSTNGHAAPTLEFTVGSGTTSDTLTINDGGAQDILPNPGEVGFQGTLGLSSGNVVVDDPASEIWEVELETFDQTEQSTFGSAVEFFNVRRQSDVTSGDTLDVLATADGFTSPVGPVNATTDFSPSETDEDSMLDFASTVDGTTLVDADDVGDGFTAITSQTLNTSAPYSITHTANLTSNTSGEATAGSDLTNTFDATTSVQAVPGPATIGMLGIGLLALGVAARHRQQ